MKKRTVNRKKWEKKTKYLIITVFEKRTVIEKKEGNLIIVFEKRAVIEKNGRKEQSI